jgi:hypothetical protein
MCLAEVIHRNEKAKLAKIFLISKAILKEKIGAFDCS